MSNTSISGMNALTEDMTTSVQQQSDRLLQSFEQTKTEQEAEYSGIDATRCR